jgi:hypothetical protein
MPRLAKMVRVASEAVEGVEVDSGDVVIEGRDNCSKVT